MAKSGKRWLWAALILCAFQGTAMAVSVPGSDPTYLIQDDLVAWNWRILGLSGVFPEVPQLPTGTTDWIRLYSNGSSQRTPNKTLPSLIKPVISPTAQYDIGPTAEWWYGFDTAKNNPLDTANDPVSRVLTAGEVLSTIRLIEADSSVVTPVFAFDQNQTGNQPIPQEELPAGWPTTGSPAPDEPVPKGQDKWLRGRLILVPPTAPFLGGQGLSWFIGKTAATISTTMSNFTPPPDPAFFTPGVDASGVVTFYFRDTFFNIFPDPSHTDPWSFNWSYLPGIYDPREFFSIPDGYFPDPSELPVNNNQQGGANLADWGGYLAGLDLSMYEDYAFLVSIETLFNNDGPPEAYIIGGLTGEFVIPEPLTIIGVMGGIGALAGYIRKRLLA